MITFWSQTKLKRTVSCGRRWGLTEYVFGGFHLSNRGSGPEALAALDRLAETLKGTKARDYTGHCTGLESFQRLKAVMGDKICYMAAGSTIHV